MAINPQFRLKEFGYEKKRNRFEVSLLFSTLRIALRAAFMQPAKPAP